MSDLDAIDRFGQHTNTCRICRANLHDLCPTGIGLMQAAAAEMATDPALDVGLAAAYDFEHPDEVAKRAICAKEGHETNNYLASVDATHGTKDYCLRCGKFWHGEPTPEEIK